MTITGIPRKENENCKTLLANFFKKVILIELDIPVTRANRMCGGNSDTILFYVAKTNFKGVLFKHVKNLKNKTNGNYFKLREYLTGQQNEDNRRVREAINKNRTLLHDTKLQLKIAKRKTACWGGKVLFAN